MRLLRSLMLHIDRWQKNIIQTKMETVLTQKGFFRLSTRRTRFYVIQYVGKGTINGLPTKSESSKK